jgi:mannose-6-phosphate isomerase-like protein (cupin superfamily)
VNPLASAPLRMPGATLVTRLRVYDTLAPDGQRGGTPHVHFLCTEMYFVLAGRGAVELIDAQGFRTVPLQPHTALTFSPGTVHRLINPEGDLELLVVMQNSGLPERGDNVVCFGETILNSDEAYAAAMKVASFAEAYRRRDRGVEGFLGLKAAFAEGAEVGRQALGRFYRLASDRTATLRPTWQTIIENGALAEARTSLGRVAALQRDDLSYLTGAQSFAAQAGDYETPGFCGALNRYFDPATLELEGAVHAGTGAMSEQRQ